MTDSEFQLKYKEYIEDFLSYSETVFSRVQSPNKLAEAMKYSFFAGGKRIRPVLTIAFGECLGLEKKEVMPFAFGLECIHTSSLIHDDLPCMDNDVLRRGMPTCHVKFDESTALLAGDALLNFAFEHISCVISDKTQIAALKYLAEYSGVNGMMSGQQSDKENEKITNREETNLLNTYGLKTGKLLTAPFVIPSVLKGDKNLIRLAEEAGEKFGQAFQFADDLKDVLLSSKEIGKTSGKDERENKFTSVSIYGVEETKHKVKLLLEDVKAILKKCNASAFLLKIIDSVTT